MRTLDIDSLLGSDYPEASLHDAELVEIRTNFVGKQVGMRFRVVIEVLGNQPKFRAGTLTLKGLVFLATEPPDAPMSEWRDGHRWITADGPYPDPQLRCSVAVPEKMPETAFCHYFFASDTNSSIVVAATDADFRWDERGPV